VVEPLLGIDDDEGSAVMGRHVVKVARTGIMVRWLPLWLEHPQSVGT
jgi:hypothetical protein